MKIATWFHSPVSATANPASRAGTLRERSIPNVMAIPIGAPPGTTEMSAVEACVTLSAERKPSPGMTTIHGKAKVAMLSAVATTRIATQAGERVLSCRHTWPYRAIVGRMTAKATAMIAIETTTPPSLPQRRPRRRVPPLRASSPPGPVLGGSTAAPDPSAVPGLSPPPGSPSA